MSDIIHFENQDGEKLAGTLEMPEKPTNRAVVMGHCFTCSRHIRLLIDLSQDLARAGYMALRFDFSGNGQSEGDFARTSYSKHIGEMKQAVTMMGRKGAEWIGLAGHSMGAAVSLLTAVEMEEVKAVCTIGGRYSQLDPLHLFSEIQKRELKETGKVSFSSRGQPLELNQTFFQDAVRHDLSQAVESLNKPLLIVHGDRDDIIEVEAAYQGRDLKPSGIDLVIIEGADHMFMEKDHRRLVSDRVVDWFNRQNHGPRPI